MERGTMPGIPPSFRMSSPRSAFVIGRRHKYNQINNTAHLEYMVIKTIKYFGHKRNLIVFKQIN